MSRHYSSRSYGGYGSSRRRTGADRFGILTFFLLLISSGFLAARLLTTGVLTQKLTLLLLSVLAGLNVLFAVTQLPRWRNKLWKLVLGVVALVLSAGMIYATVATNAVLETLSRVSSTGSVKTVVVRVRENDSAQEIGDTFGYTYGYLAQTDTDTTDALLTHLEEGLGQVKTKSYDTPTALADALYNREVDAVILGKGMVSTLKQTDGYKDFTSRTREIYTYDVTHESDAIAPNANISRQPFVVYCSGTDERISDTLLNTRSDANILAVVNPSTHKILLVNIPRDYYLPLPFNGEMDKLTHFSVYSDKGMDEPIEALNTLLGVKADYYARVNFSGLMDIVDALGGIDVTSPVDFTTIAMEMPNENGDGGYHDESFTFTEGVNHLNGREALAFSRERSAFAQGDVQRGRNQMAVLQAIINKATSPAILSGYQDVLRAVSDSLLTNMPQQDILKLVKLQLEDKVGWDISTYTLTGTTDMQDCFTTGFPLSVLVPDESSVAAARRMIRSSSTADFPRLSGKFDISPGFSQKSLVILLSILYNRGLRPVIKTCGPSSLKQGEMCYDFQTNAQRRLRQPPYGVDGLVRPDCAGTADGVQSGAAGPAPESGYAGQQISAAADGGHPDPQWRPRRGAAAPPPLQGWSCR